MAKVISDPNTPGRNLEINLDEYKKNRVILAISKGGRYVGASKPNFNVRFGADMIKQSKNLKPNETAYLKNRIKDKSGIVHDLTVMLTKETVRYRFDPTGDFTEEQRIEKLTNDKVIYFKLGYASQR